MVVGWGDLVFIEDKQKNSILSLEDDYFRNKKNKLTLIYENCILINLKSYFINGNLEQTGNYKFGKKDGDWIDFNEDGSMKKIIRYEDGKIIEIKNK